MLENLKNLYNWIATVNLDIEKSNEYTKINYEALTACGEIYNSMVYNIFKEYLKKGYTEFVGYIKHHKYKCGDGDDIDKNKLMNLELDRYKNICTKDKWLRKCSEEEKIVDQSSGMKNMKDINIKLAKSISTKGRHKVY